MLTIERADDQWTPAESDQWDMRLCRHRAESLAEISGRPHRITNDSRAILFCTGCQTPPTQPTKEEAK